MAFEEDTFNLCHELTPIGEKHYMQLLIAAALEEVERNKKLLEKNKEKETLTGGNEESEVYNGDGNKLPPV